MSAMKATAGPFIVTHRHGTETFSRRAFATLEDAREHAWTTTHQIDASTHSLSLARAKWGTLTETGGTVELPDGTVIEVEPIGFSRLYDAAGMTWLATPGEVIQAFNAKQAA